MDVKESLKEVFEACRSARALIHHITNYVTVNDCANVVLAIGASPIMADEISEVEEMVRLCNALVLNIGTANRRTVEAMIKAGTAANGLQIPVVLDPVGVGATVFRYESVKKILENVEVSVIRGNMAEIKTIAGLEAKSAGVDSLEEESEGASIAKEVAKRLKCCIAITGKDDVVSDGRQTYLLSNGNEALTRITGTGCMSTSLIGSFLGSSREALLSSIAGISTMAIAGELAEKTKGNATFHTALLDAISQMHSRTLLDRLKIKCVE